MIIVWGSVEAAAEDYAENHHQLNFFEEWEDLDALHRHFEVSESVVFATRLRELANEPPVLRIFDASRVR